MINAMEEEFVCGSVEEQKAIHWAVIAAMRATSVAKEFHYGFIEKDEAVIEYAKAYGIWEAMTCLADDMGESSKWRLRECMPLPCKPDELLEKFAPEEEEATDETHDDERVSAAMSRLEKALDEILMEG